MLQTEENHIVRVTLARGHHFLILVREKDFSREKSSKRAIQFFCCLPKAQESASFSLLVFLTATYPDIWLYILACSHKVKMYFQHLNADEPRNRTVLQKNQHNNQPHSSGQFLWQEQVAKSSGRQPEAHSAAPEQCREMDVSGSRLPWCRRYMVWWGKGEALCIALLLSSQRDQGQTQSSQQTKSYPILLGLVLQTFNQMQKRKQWYQACSTIYKPF